MRDADAVILVVDATVGVTEEDASVADWLRRAKRPVLLVANKVDSEARRSDIWAFVVARSRRAVRGDRVARPRHW